MLIFAGTVFGQPTGGYTYILRPMDYFETMAGMPVDLPIYVENSGSASVTLTFGVSQDPNGHFSIDSLSQIKHLYPGMMDVGVLHFAANATGSYQALVTVSDGVVTDSLMVTVVVRPGPGPFVLLPPFQQVPADLNTPTSIPVIIQNLTSSDMSVQLSLTGASEFTYAGNSPLTIPALGSTTALVDFLTATDGLFNATVKVTGGGYTDSVWIEVVAADRPYTWIIPFMNEIETMAGYEAMLPMMLLNSGSAPVTLQLALTGSNVFSLDPSNTPMTLLPGMGMDAKIHVLSNTTGTYTTLFTVTDGVTTDTLELRAVVTPGAGNFILMPDYQEIRADQSGFASAEFHLQSLSNSTLNLTATLVGHSGFTFAGNTPFTLAPQDGMPLRVNFNGTTQGMYTAMLNISDGVESDSAMLVVYVGMGHGGGPLFTLQFDGKENFMLFETPENTTLTKDITITNISDSSLHLTLHFDSDGSFSIPWRSLTIDSGATQTLAVTFDNSFGGYGDGMLMIDGGIQVEPVFLMGMTPPYNDYDGVLVTKEIDFGMVDSNITFCLDALIENTSSNTITVTGATLSGFSNAFTLQPNTFPVSLQPNGMTVIPVCFRPLSVNQVENEVLTIAFTNPASTPTAQSAIVNLTGRSSTGIVFPGDSCGLIGWYVNTIAAPIGGQSESTIELFNISDQPITLDKSYWEEGNDLGIFSMQTTLPITIQPHNPAVSGSGKSDFTIRYAPTSQSSTVGTEDVATLLLESSVSSKPLAMWLMLVGIPVNPAPNSGTIVLFPKNNRVPSIEMGALESGGTRILEFSNNLEVPVTIRGFQLSTNERFEITNTMEFPKTLQPGETAALMLRSNGLPPTRSTDVLTMQSSHDHLNSRFDLISGNTVTGIGDLPAVASQITATISPNPSAGRLQVSLSAPLAQGRVRVLDMLGRVVAEHDGALQNWSWDARINGAPAQAGAYHILVSGVTETGAHVSITKNAMIVR